MNINNTNIQSFSLLPTPNELKSEFPLTQSARNTVLLGRETIGRILKGEDDRLLVVVGPCSIHKPKEALEYASRLVSLSREFDDSLYISMRVVCGKPRSRARTNGRPSWQGLFSDPRLNGSCDTELGLRTVRKLMLEIAESGLPQSTEMLDEVDLQYVDDLLSNGWAGARDTDSQRKKKIASALSTPVGFKNPTTGSEDVAIHSIEFAKDHQVLSAPNGDGRICEVRTLGNHLGYLIHRGFNDRTNFNRRAIEESSEKLRRLGLIDRIVVDVSHGNSRKNHMNQRGVILYLVKQIRQGNRAIGGIMYESYLEDGQQAIPVDLSELKPGVSVTDACDGWERTEKTLRILGKEYKKKMKK